MTTTITIDGHAYTVPIKTISRSADPLEKSAERTADGTLHVERIGIFYNYVVEFGAPKTSAEVAELAALYLVISSPTVFHSVLIPGENGNAPWQAYFAGVKDEIRKRVSSVSFWKNLSCSIIAKSPQRT